MVNIASEIDVTFVDGCDPFSRNKKLRIGNYPTAFELDNNFASHDDVKNQAKTLDIAIHFWPTLRKMLTAPPSSSTDQLKAESIA